ncbi:MAG: BatD family protein [Methyloprofundus sp.]|nr:BatD family protein [Methyloprofundus sp.]
MKASYAYKVLFALVCLFSFGLSSFVYAADIKVQIDRNPVNIQESFQIIFTANESPDDDPDFSPLNKDFEILNQTEQQSTKIVNWKRTKSIQWILTVMPKQAGSIIIPAIHFGEDTSLVTAIVVTEAQQQANANINEELFLQASVNTDTPYIQEQVTYTLKLFRKVNISQASLSEPVLNDAVIVRLGEDKNYNTKYNGENYVVLERDYAIFPQKSGAMTIAPLVLTAGIIVNNNQTRYNSFFSRQSTRNKRVSSNSIQLNVQAKPASQTGSIWLPAEQVYIQEKWSIDPQNITLGEPVTRTISLFVKGVTAGALPELQTQTLPKQIKAYPDQPLVKESPQGKVLVALREEKIALIASEIGTYTLPAIEIPWWNTTTQTQEMAVIPEKQLIVVAGEQSHTVDVPPVAILEKSDEVMPRSDKVQSDHNLWFALAIFFGTGWALTLLYLIISRKSVKKTAHPQKIKLDTSSAHKILQQACAENNSDKAKQALLEWGREHFQKNSLEAIAKQCDSALAKEIQRLNAVLYSQAESNWQGEALWLAFKQNKQLEVALKQVGDSLPPLFKI